MQKLKADAMKELVSGNRLERADILVTHGKRGLLGRLIRFGTDSYWNHALMVYVIRDPKGGYDNTFIIESGGKGIDIHNINHYFHNLKKCDVGILRWEPDWLKNDPSERLRYCRKIRGFALEEIDDKYNHGMIVKIALAILFPLLRAKPADKRTIRTPGFLKRMNMNTYICSGFVQWAYCKGVTRIAAEDKRSSGTSTEPAPGKDIDTRFEDALFNPCLPCDICEEDLLSTTPADIANSDNLTWKYIIKDEVVWEVSTRDEVTRVLGIEEPRITVKPTISHKLR